MGSLDAYLRHAGAVMVRRAGRPVAVHYGSAGAEVTVCARSAGVAIRSDLCTIDLTGESPWLEVLVERESGHPASAVGSATQVAGTWCARVADRRLTLIGDAAAIERWRTTVRRAVLAGSRVGVGERPDEDIVIDLLGPKAPALLAAAGLPVGEPGSVALAALADRAVYVLRAGPTRALLIVSSGPAAADVCRALFEMGGELKPALVGADAVAMTGAAAASRRAAHH